MKILIDENLLYIKGSYLEILKQNGFDVYKIGDHPAPNKSTTDSDILQWMKTNGCQAILTVNVKDFDRKYIRDNLDPFHFTVVAMKPVRLTEKQFEDALQHLLRDKPLSDWSKLNKVRIKWEPWRSLEEAISKVSENFMKERYQPPSSKRESLDDD